MNRTSVRHIAASVIVGAAMAWGGLLTRQTTQLAAAEPDSPPPAANREDGSPQRPGEPGRNGPADHRDRPGAQENGDRRPAGPPGVQRAIDDLKLSDEQKQKVDPIVQAYRQKQQQAREDFLKQMKEVLNPQQFEAFDAAMTRRPPAPPAQANRDAAKPPAEQSAAPAAPAVPTADAEGRIAVVITGGYDTDPRNHGRPVVLIAAALKVTPEVFRDAFSGVHPASRDGGPTDAEARQNKQVLMGALGPHGITDDRLNEVSNYYRYSSRKGQMWRNTPATAYATVHNGVVTITLENPGSGYSSPPKVSLPGMPNLSATASLSFGTDFSKNGSIKEITVQP